MRIYIYTDVFRYTMIYIYIYIHIYKHLEIPPDVLHGVAPSFSLVNRRVPNTWTVSAKNQHQEYNRCILLRSDFTDPVGLTAGNSHEPGSPVGDR